MQPGSGESARVADAQLEQLARHFRDRVLKEHDIRELASMARNRLRRTLELSIQRMLSDERRILPRSQQAQLISIVLDETVGFGPLERLLGEEEISEIMVVGPEEIYVERNGKIQPADVRFRDDDHIQHVVERIIAPLGRRLDDSSPMVDARLPGGSRVNAVIPPIAVQGPVVTIRKFRETPFRLTDLAALGAMTPEMATFLAAAVRAKLNMLVSGGTGSGKTTLLSACAGEIPAGERLIIIEDMSELRLARRHVISLEARPPNVEGRGEVSIRSLVRNALRMRPDRMLVGEVRGAEALDMLQAMNSGHEGSLTTIHANSPQHALSRLEAMVIMATSQMPVQIIREHILSAIDLVVQTERLTDGSRKVVAIAEVDARQAIQMIFHFQRTATGPDGRVQGRFVPMTGLPACWGRLQTHGVAPDAAIFGGAES